jgi:hypothetical protein
MTGSLTSHDPSEKKLPKHLPTEQLVSDSTEYHGIFTTSYIFLA